jgi:hypothetical protein
MSRSRVNSIVRNFPENSIKLLLEDPKNVRDLLEMAGAEIIPWIDFDTLEPVKTTFVHRDYRHVEADVVLVASLRDPAGKRRRPRKKLLIYILLEHQSKPSRLLPLRELDYMVQIFKYQQRQWMKMHSSLEGIRFAPVLPVVFYTGTDRWDSPGSLAERIEPRGLADRFTPAKESIYLNLPAMDARQLEAKGGFFGWVLRLVQRRKAQPERFRALVLRVVAALEAMPAAERLRWLELLSYSVALIYHTREPWEWPLLQETIEASVRTDQHRQELFDMGRTIAEELKEEGIRQGREAGRETGREEGREEGLREGESRGRLTAGRQTLIRLLRKRFGEIPQEWIETVEATQDAATLDRWLDHVVTAETPDDVGIGRSK